MKIVAVLYPGGEIARKTPELLGCAENALGLTDFLKSQGHEFVVLTDKEAELDKQLPTTDILITTPFWPAYDTKERISKAPKLKLALTAGVGSDHIDLEAAAARNIIVAEITGSNVVSVAEQVVMHILALVRNYIPAYNRFPKENGILQKLRQKHMIWKIKLWEYLEWEGLDNVYAKD
jgi:formate dehydrogenase